MSEAVFREVAEAGPRVAASLAILAIGAFIASTVGQYSAPAAYAVAGASALAAIWLAKRLAGQKGREGLGEGVEDVEGGGGEEVHEVAEGLHDEEGRQCRKRPEPAPPRRGVGGS